MCYYSSFVQLTSNIYGSIKLKILLILEEQREHVKDFLSSGAWFSLTFLLQYRKTLMHIFLIFTYMSMGLILSIYFI
jgi:hypothetical protein